MTSYHGSVFYDTSDGIDVQMIVHDLINVYFLANPGLCKVGITLTAAILSY